MTVDWIMALTSAAILAGAALFSKGNLASKLTTFMILFAFFLLLYRGCTAIMPDNIQHEDQHCYDRQGSYGC